MMIHQLFKYIIHGCSSSQNLNHLNIGFHVAHQNWLIRQSRIIVIFPLLKENCVNNGFVMSKEYDILTV